jgi:hypothetical protein
METRRPARSKPENAKGRRSSGEVVLETRMVQNCPGNGGGASVSHAKDISYMFSHKRLFEVTSAEKCLIEYKYKLEFIAGLHFPVLFWLYTLLIIQSRELKQRRTL